MMWLKSNSFWGFTVYQVFWFDWSMSALLSPYHINSKPVFGDIFLFYFFWCCHWLCIHCCLELCLFTVWQLHIVILSTLPRAPRPPVSPLEGALQSISTGICGFEITEDTNMLCKTPQTGVRFFFFLFCICLMFFILLNMHLCVFRWVLKLHDREKNPSILIYI